MAEAKPKIGLYFLVILGGGPATAFGFRLISPLTNEDLSVGPRLWPDFRLQRHPRKG
jgi:hypothetical protein